MDNVLDNVVENKNTGADPGEVGNADNRTFSQEEVNNIIKERLAKEKDKSERHYETLAKEYEQKVLNLKAKELIIDKGLPASILEILKFDDEEMLIKNLQILDGIINSGKNEDPGYGLILNSGGSHGSIQHTGDESIKKAMGLK